MPFQQQVGSANCNRAIEACCTPPNAAPDRAERAVDPFRADRAASILHCFSLNIFAWFKGLSCSGSRLGELWRHPVRTVRDIEALI
jgi:hypothetical protein